MTIEQMQQAKREAEAEIAATLTRFAERTGLQVADVRVQFASHQPLGGWPRQVVSGVTMDAKL